MVPSNGYGEANYGSCSRDDIPSSCWRHHDVDDEEKHVVTNASGQLNNRESQRVLYSSIDTMKPPSSYQTTAGNGHDDADRGKLTVTKLSTVSRIGTYTLGAVATLLLLVMVVSASSYYSSGPSSLQPHASLSSSSTSSFLQVNYHFAGSYRHRTHEHRHHHHKHHDDDDEDDNRYDFDNTTYTPAKN